MNTMLQIRKALWDEPMAVYGFRPYKKLMLARTTPGSVFQFMHLEPHRHEKKFTVDIAIRPLFCPQHDQLGLRPGNRLRHFMGVDQDRWWYNGTEQEARHSFNELTGLIQQHALPFFEATTSAEGIIKSYEKNWLGRTAFGNKVDWGTLLWKDNDMGHVYLKAKNFRKAHQHFDQCIQEAATDDRQWAKQLAAECVQIKNRMEEGPASIEVYLEEIMSESRQFLELSE